MVPTKPSRRTIPLTVGRRTGGPTSTSLPARSSSRNEGIRSRPPRPPGRPPLGGRRIGAAVRALVRPDLRRLRAQDLPADADGDLGRVGRIRPARLALAFHRAQLPAGVEGP